jgi:hypothetical protein
MEEEFAMARIVAAAVVGGLIVFIWGAVSWMALPFHTMSLQTLPGERQEVDALLSRIHEHGVYHYPGFPHHEDGREPTDEEWEETWQRYRSGPVVSMMVVQPDGIDPFATSKFIVTLAINMVGAGVLAVLIAGVRRSGASWGAAMGYVVGFAIFAVCAGVLPSWLWWSYPWLFGLLEVTDILIAWLLAGAVICAIVSPRQRLPAGPSV